MYSCPTHISDAKFITAAHGGGGSMTAKLIKTVFTPRIGSKWLNEAHDGAIFNIGTELLAMSTDSFVVSPLFFPGGNIGDLAVNGTVNDILCCGAKPIFLSLGFIIEEGFPISLLCDITDSISNAARAANVQVVTADTKVVEHGKCDGLYINSTGIGSVFPHINISPKNASLGDVIIISGSIGNHGIAVMSQREGMDFESEIKSDTAALVTLITSLLAAVPHTHVLRDATRGGLSSALNEIASSANVGIDIEQNLIPIQCDVDVCCELLGLDPLQVANEGVIVAIVPATDAERALAVMRNDVNGHNAAIIGKVTESHFGGLVRMTMPGGGVRKVDMISGEQLPRIC